MKRSETIIEFAKALSAFNAEVGALAKDAKNPFFKSDYLTLDKIIEETRPILQKNGLSLMQFPSGDGQTVSVTTMLLHTSGEFIEAEPLIMKPAKNDPQGLGSAITYARRYAYQAILSLNTGEDDDGNQASGKNKGGQQQSQPQNNNYSNNNNSTKPKDPKETEIKPITAGQKTAVNTVIKEFAKLCNVPTGDVVTELEKTPIGSFGDVGAMTSGQASKTIKLVNQWITNRKAKQGESQ